MGLIATYWLRLGEVVFTLTKFFKQLLVSLSFLERLARYISMHNII